MKTEYSQDQMNRSDIYIDIDLTARPVGHGPESIKGSSVNITRISDIDQ